MTDYKIEKDVPIRCSRGPDGSSKYPFSEMEVGDSFFHDSPPNSPASSVRGNASQWGAKQTPKKRFSSSREGSGFRVWRTE